MQPVFRIFISRNGWKPRCPHGLTLKHDQSRLFRERFRSKSGIHKRHANKCLKVFSRTVLSIVPFAASSTTDSIRRLANKCPAITAVRHNIDYLANIGMTPVKYPQTACTTPFTSKDYNPTISSVPTRIQSSSPIMALIRYTYR